MPGEVMDVAEVFAILRRRSWVLAVSMFVGLSLAVLYLLSVTPRYAGTAEIVLQRTSNVVDQESVAATSDSDTSEIATEVQILQSVSLAREVIETLGLDEDEEFVGSDEPSPIGSLMEQIGLAGLLGGSDEDEDEASENATRTALGGFQDRLTVQRKSLTRVVDVTFRSEDPDKAALIANAIADTYIDRQVRSKLETNANANRWLAERLYGLRDELQAAEERVAIFRAERNLVGADGGLLNEQQISELSAQLIRAQADLAEREARLDRVRSLIDSGGDPATVLEVVQSGTIAALRRQRAEVVRRRADLQSRYGRRHPEIIKVDQEIDDLEDEISEEVTRITSSLENEVAIALERVKSLEAGLSTLSARSSTNNTDMIELRQLQREADAVRAVYESFLARFQGTSQARLFGQSGEMAASARPITRASAVSNRLA
ncbi:MAG: GumC family protein [Pseudomonadota bacterium]